MWNLLEFFLVFCIACAFLFLSLLITSLIHFSYRHVSPCSKFFVNMLYFLCISIFITSNNLIDCLHLIVFTKNTSDNLFYKNTIVTILFYFIFWHSSQLGAYKYFTLAIVLPSSLCVMYFLEWCFGHFYVCGMCDGTYFSHIDLGGMCAGTRKGRPWTERSNIY